MTKRNLVRAGTLAVATAALIFLAAPRHAWAHCDTLDGPVVQDAEKAIQARDVTPVLKWVKEKDEKAVRAAFKKVLADSSGDTRKARERFFATLVKIHRAGEGAPFTGLKAAGTVEPAIAAADGALKSGSADQLVQLVTDEVAAGIRNRYQRAAQAYRHKDESVAQGREFVEAYVEYTHYVEGLQKQASGAGAHAGHGGHAEPAGSAPKKKQHHPD